MWRNIPCLEIEWPEAQDAGLPFHVRQALKRGESIGFEGRDLKPELWCTQPRKARSYVYSSDTRPCESLRIAAQGATLLYHDATFNEADAEQAKSTHHSTTTEAARLARQAEVETLMLGHLSLRYKNLDALREEALQEHRMWCWQRMVSFGDFDIALTRQHLSLSRIILSNVSSSQTNLAIGDSSALFRLGVRNMVRQIDGVEVIGKLPTGGLDGLVQSFRA